MRTIFKTKLYFELLFIPFVGFTLCYILDSAFITNNILFYFTILIELLVFIYLLDKIIVLYEFTDDNFIIYKIISQKKELISYDEINRIEFCDKGDIRYSNFTMGVSFKNKTLKFNIKDNDKINDLLTFIHENHFHIKLLRNTRLSYSFDNFFDKIENTTVSNTTLN